MAGLFFCLASTRCRAFILLCCNTATRRRLQRLLFRSCKLYSHNAKTVYRALQGISVDFPHSSTHNTAATQTAYAPPATHWRAYRQALHLHRYQIPPPRRTLYKSAQPPIIIAQTPIIIRYIRGAQTMPARRGLRLSCVDRWQVLHRAHLLRGSASPPVQGQPGGLRSDTLHPAGQSNSGRRGTIDGCRRISFRAFARCQ